VPRSHGPLVLYVGAILGNSMRKTLHVVERELSATGVTREDCSDLSTTLRCSHCQARGSMCNSTLRWFDVPLLLLLLRPKRCLSCYKRSYKWLTFGES
jgi:hypothetical protein